MSGTEVFVYAVDHGWVGKSSIAIAELGEITVSDNNAIASVVVGGQPAPGTEFRFVKENGSWRFDLVPVLASSSLLIQQLARQRGLAEDELILQLIENVAGTRPPPTIWEPLAPEHSRCTASR